MLTQLQWLTDFGDQAVVLPVACAVAIFLAASRWWHGVRVWLLAMVAVLATMLVLKLMFGACGWEAPLARINSPSGHTASAAVLYGGLGALLVRRLDVAGTGLLALALAILFGTTRVLLDDHTISEVVVGGAVGIAGTVMLRRLMGPPPERLRRSGLLVVVLVTAWAVHGRHLPAEQKIHAFAATRLPGVACPR